MLNGSVATMTQVQCLTGTFVNINAFGWEVLVERILHHLLERKSGRSFQSRSNTKPLLFAGGDLKGTPGTSNFSHLDRQAKQTPNQAVVYTTILFCPSRNTPSLPHIIEGWRNIRFVNVNSIPKQKRDELLNVPGWRNFIVTATHFGNGINWLKRQFRNRPKKRRPRFFPAESSMTASALFREGMIQSGGEKGDGTDRGRKNLNSCICLEAIVIREEAELLHLGDQFASWKQRKPLRSLNQSRFL